VPADVEDRVELLFEVAQRGGGVVDDPCGAERAHELGLGGPADTGDGGAEVDGELDGERAHPSRGADDEHPITAADAGLAQRLEGGETRDGDGRGLLHGDGRRAGCEAGERQHRELGERPAGGAVHGIPDGVLGDAVAQRDDRAGHVAPGDPVLRAAQTQAEPSQQGQAGHDVPRAAVDPGRGDANEHLAGAGGRVGHLGEGQLVAGAVLVLHDGSHDIPYAVSQGLFGTR
jgi:hypothetical protein